jgi:nucleoside-diphosphate-sugar epimerase
VLGAGGKMGPTLARMAARTRDAEKGGARRRVIAVSRFSAGGLQASLQAAGVETVACDLLDRDAVARLPDAPNVVFMAGQKFGTHDAPSRTWMMNVVVPAICAERYAGSRIVAFSTGNVYPLTPVSGSGARESDATAPIGEYAETCVGRERVFEHFAATHGTKVAIVRLNYAIALRYGVLTDLALKVADGVPIPLAMGHVNVIWQGDANRTALELLPHASSPPLVVNVTGIATLSVRSIAIALGQRLGRDPRFKGSEAPDALLSNTDRMRSLLGEPETSLDTMLDWVADWVKAERPLLGKATHFEARDGKF